MINVKSMLTLTSVAALFLGLSVALGVSSSGDEPDGGVGNPAAVDASHSNHDEQHQQTESRFAPSKPMSVVHFVKPERYLASSGETVTIGLTLMVSVPVEAIQVTARAEKGAVISARQLDLGALAAGEERKVHFDVTVLAEGRHYINVFARAETSDGVRQSVHSVPIEVGNALASKKRRHMVTDDQGNTLLLMPAVTTKGDEQPR